MPIALDARMIGHSGIGTAIRSYLEGLAQLPAAERPPLVLLGDPRQLAAAAEPLGASIIPFTAPVYSLAEQLSYPRPRGRWDLLHVPHYAHPLAYRGPLLASVHDRFHIKYGSPFKRAYQRLMLARLRQRGCPILTDCESVKAELVANERFDPARIRSIKLGLPRQWLDGHAADFAETRRALQLPESYALWVGIDQPHKNLDRLLNALRRLYAENKLAMPFVLAGLAPRDVPRLQQKIAALDLRKQVQVIPRFAERYKQALFAGARAFIFPSLDEGFGYPPLEAMALGVPCAVSDCAPMNELCGPAALLFDPLSEEAIARAILRISGDEDLRSDLKQKAQAHLAQFSCLDAARQLVQAYEQALAE